MTAAGLIQFECQCGAGNTVQASVMAQISHCPVCHAPIRLTCGAPLQDDCTFSARLIVRAGPLDAGCQVLLGGGKPIEVGKLKGKHLMLAGTLVSRNHCQLVPTGSKWRLVDGGSTNGSFVNGMRVASRELTDGDVLRLGENEFEFHDAPPAMQASIPRHREPEPVDEEPFASLDTYEDPIPIAAADQSESSSRPTHIPLTGVPVEADDFVDEAASGGSAATAPASFSNLLDPTDYGSYDLAPTAGPGRPTRAPANDNFPAVAPPAARSFRAAAADALRPALICPACNRTLARGAKICVDCGVDARTGRPIITAQGLDEDQLYGNAETIVKIISWIFPFGLYPIASEAYGAFKPYAIWAIAVFTIFTSLCFWVESGDPRGPTRQLLLWAGSISPGQVELIYGEPGLVNTADRAAYDTKVKQLKGTVPQRELPLEAYNALPSEHQIFGHFEWYQLITCAFLHGGLMHLAGNLLFLLVFGSRVNALLGQWKTAVLYPILAIAAGIAYCIAESSKPPMPSLGASGAIMGLAGMYLILFPVHRVHNVIWFRISPIFAPIFMLRVWAASGGESGLLRPWMKLFALRGFWVVLFFIAFDVIYTLFRIEDHVAHWAHLGGFIGGVIIAITLLLTRVVDARGGDLLSVALGKYAWPLIGKPGHYAAAVGPAEAQGAAV